MTLRHSRLCIEHGAVCVKEVLHVLFGGANEDAVTQVQDVAIASGLAAAVLHGSSDGIGVSKEHSGIHVALHGHVGPETGAGVSHVDRPVEADRVDACGPHALQEASAAVGIEGQGDVGVFRLAGVDNLLDVGLRPLLPEVRGELPSPRVEDLDHLSPRPVVFGCQHHQNQNTRRPR